MGSISSWAADQDREEAEDRWAKESKEILSKIDPGVLRTRMDTLFHDLEKTQQKKYTWNLIETLKEMLEL